MSYPKRCRKEREKKRENKPESLGRALQQQWPLVRMKLMSFLSSSTVHGPFFNPTLSQHGCLPISLLSLTHTLYIYFMQRYVRKQVPNIVRMLYFHDLSSYTTTYIQRVRDFKTMFVVCGPTFLLASSFISSFFFQPYNVFKCILS